MLKDILLVLSLLTFTVGKCVAQTFIPVEVFHTSDDSVGRAIAFHLKDALRGSNTFRLLPDNLPIDKQARIRMNLVSIDSDSPSRGISSSISISIVFDSINTPLMGAYITSVVQNCGNTRTQQCANNLLPYLESAKERIRKDGPIQWQALTGEGLTNTPEIATPRSSTNERTKPKPTAPVNPF